MQAVIKKILIAIFSLGFLILLIAGFSPAVHSHSHDRTQETAQTCLICTLLQNQTDTATVLVVPVTFALTLTETNLPLNQLITLTKASLHSPRGPPFLQ